MSIINNLLLGYTAASSSVAAMQASRSRALAEAQSNLLNSKEEAENYENLIKEELFQFTNFLKQSVAENRYTDFPEAGIYETQRFYNWCSVNKISSASFRNIEDKSYLDSSLKAARKIESVCASSLNDEKISAYKRIAIIEDTKFTRDLLRELLIIRDKIKSCTPLMFNSLSTNWTIFVIGLLIPFVISFTVYHTTSFEIFDIIGFTAFGSVGLVIGRRFKIANFNKRLSNFGWEVNQKITKKEIDQAISNLTKELKETDSKFTIDTLNNYENELKEIENLIEKTN